MKSRLLIIAPMLLCLTISLALGEKQRRAVQADRVPQIDIVNAIQLTVEHHKKKLPEMGDIFVDEAVFVRTESGSFWKIGVRLKDRETGHLFYKVDSEGKIESHSVVKDG